MKNLYNVFSDGGSRGNPGPAAIGYVVYKNNTILFRGSQYIGHTTNNEAEYMAILKALTKIKLEISAEGIIKCYLDSELVVRQLLGIYKIKNINLKNIATQVFSVINDLKNIGFTLSFQSIPREGNKEADSLVNQALDMELNQQ